MNYYNENNHTDSYEQTIDIETGEAVSKPKKEPKNKLALKVVDIFNQMCEEKTGIKRKSSKGEYYVAIEAVKAIPKDKLVLFMEDWFNSGKPNETIIHFNQCFSTFQINNFKAKYGK